MTALLYEGSLVLRVYGLFRRKENLVFKDDFHPHKCQHMSKNDSDILIKNSINYYITTILQQMNLFSLNAHLVFTVALYSVLRQFVSMYAYSKNI